MQFISKCNGRKLGSRGGDGYTLGQMLRWEIGQVSGR